MRQGAAPEKNYSIASATGERVCVRACVRACVCVCVCVCEQAEHLVYFHIAHGHAEKLGNLRRRIRSYDGESRCRASAKANSARTHASRTHARIAHARIARASRTHARTHASRTHASRAHARIARASRTHASRTHAHARTRTHARARTLPVQTCAYRVGACLAGSHSDHTARVQCSTCCRNSSSLKTGEETTSSTAAVPAAPPLTPPALSAHHTSACELHRTHMASVFNACVHE